MPSFAAAHNALGERRLFTVPQTQSQTSTSTSTPQSGNLSFCLDCGVWGDKGVRRTMEDEHLVCHSLCAVNNKLPKEFDFAIYGVFDGHGGPQTALFVKEQIAYELANQLLALSEDQVNDIPLPDSVIRRIVCSTFDKLDSRISLELPTCRDGSTAIVALVHAPVVYVASLGDAGAVLGQWRKDQPHAIPLSESHKPWVIKEKDRIIASGGTVENGRVDGVLEVSRSFGDLSLKRHGVLCIPTLQRFNLDITKDRFMILGCDGFWNSWTDLEVVNRTQSLIQKELRRVAIEATPFNPNTVCRHLVDHVIIDKKSQDNVTALLIRITKPEQGA